MLKSITWLYFFPMFSKVLYTEVLKSGKKYFKKSVCTLQHAETTRSKEDRNTSEETRQVLGAQHVT